MAKHVVKEVPALSDQTIAPPDPAASEKPLRFLIIGAGSRGNAYAGALVEGTSDAIIGAIAEPIEFKRKAFGRKYMGSLGHQDPDRSFVDWRNFLKYEKARRIRRDRGEKVPEGVNGVFVCTLDEMHAEIITALAPLGLNIMSEKPLATNLMDCLRIFRALQPPGTPSPQAIFSIGHVLHYSPHNMLLRKLLLDEGVIGDILSIEHTEPVGWWHFAHSYVR